MSTQSYGKKQENSEAIASKECKPHRIPPSILPKIPAALHLGAPHLRVETHNSGCFHFAPCFELSMNCAMVVCTEGRAKEQRETTQLSPGQKTALKTVCRMRENKKRNIWGAGEKKSPVLEIRNFGLSAGHLSSHVHLGCKMQFLR